MKKILAIIICCLLYNAAKAQLNVTQIEYFVDADAGVGQNSIINVALPDSDITQTIIVPILSNLAVGNHKLYVRTRDNNGMWSHTTRRNIQVVTTQIQNNIVAGEYYIDSDPEFGNAFSFTISPQDTDVTQSFLAQVALGTSVGFHKIYGRVKDGLGNWSHTFRRNIEIIPDTTTSIVILVEYFFGDDLEFGNCSNIIFPNPQPDGSWTFNVPYPAGGYNFGDSLFMRVREDGVFNWSHTTRLDSLVLVGINEPNPETQFAVYPNPASNIITIALKNETNAKIYYQLYNMLGELLQEEKITALKTQVQLNYTPGIYFIKVNSGTGTTTQKIIIQ